MLLARSYSHHSLLSAVPKIPALVDDAERKGYSLVVLSDEETGSGFLEFYKYTKGKENVKGTVGSTLKIPNITANENTFGRNKQFSKVVVFAKNNQGYKDLLELISTARTVQEEPAPHITLANLQQVTTQTRRQHEFFHLFTRCSLEAGDYAFFGSAPLYAHALCSAINRLDVMVTNTAWESIKTMGEVSETENGVEKMTLFDGKVVVWKNVPHSANLIQNAETIGNFQFIQLSDILEYKADLGVEEHSDDITNIQNFLAGKPPRMVNFFVTLCGNDHEIVSHIRSNRVIQADEVLAKYVEWLGAENLIVELAIPLDSDDIDELKAANLALIDLCKKYNVKYIASPAPRYLNRDDKEIFQIVLAIRDGKRKDSVQLSRDFHLPSVEELTALYSYAPEALDTSDIESQINLSIRCDYDKHADEAYFPYFELPTGQTPGERLRWESYIGFMRKFAPIPDQSIDFLDPFEVKKYWVEKYPFEKRQELHEAARHISPDTTRLLGYPKTGYWGEKKTVKDYIDRIDRELDVIITKGYPSYFLVLADIMEYCRQHNIVTNTRGSAAGCLVGYLTEIGILDPLVYDIPFERFLNPMRPSAPDIDGDFADDRREEVIQYLRDKYGKDSVSQIITFGTMLPRAVVRDVGRALGVGYKKCDTLAKLIPSAPQGKKTTFKWALETSAEFAEVYEKDEETKRVVDLAKKIEGNYRHSSCHAAGIICTPSKLTDYVPLQWDSEHKILVSQYDMKVGEEIGMVKLDILGIRNLAILGNAIELTEQRHQTRVDLLNIDLQDKKSFELLSQGRTMGLFQLSGAAMTRHLVNLGPTRVQDLMAMVALYRPGPMANIPDYIARKKNPKAIKYMVPQMEQWMADTYGILVYQDDLLYNVINLAGYTWLDADNFRKGVGKKIMEVIAAQHTKFVEGCIEHSGLTKEKAEEIWSVMEPFAAYGFNKAHASNYGMVAYWTAYMKATYTAEFMTSLMTSESNNLEKIAKAIEECGEMGINVLPPDVNKSFESFHIQDDTTIRYGLNSVKNLGSDVIDFMIQEREKNGTFANINSFLERMAGHRGFNKRGLEALIWSGSLDDLGGREVVG